MARILSIAPYKYLKPQNGGHWGIFFIETILSKKNDLLSVGVLDNEVYETPYQKLNELPKGKSRYLPGKLNHQLLAIATKFRPTHIHCHHHYLFPTAKYVADKLRLPLYIRAHNIECERFRSTGKWWWKFMFWFEQYAYKNADKTFFISDEDANWAKLNFNLPKHKIEVMPFATPFKSIPKSEVKREDVANLHQLNPQKDWLIFMGIFSYVPNQEAIELIINEIYPRLIKKDNNFEIIICGKGLKADLVDKINSYEGVHYLGFVQDLEALLHQSKIMLNPVLNGGGVKTKVLEALAWNNTVVSTEFGAFGIEQKFCGNKLKLVQNADWDSFTNNIISTLQANKEDIPESFFQQYNIDAIAERIQENYQ